MTPLVPSPRTTTTAANEGHALPHSGPASRTRACTSRLLQSSRTTDTAANEENISDSPAPASGAATVTYFPDLPLELRRLIWSWALTSPELIDISAYNRIHNHPVSLLSVCSESRLWAQQSYTSVTIPQTPGHATTPPFYYSSDGSTVLFLSRIWVTDGNLNIANISQNTAFQASIHVLAIDAKILRGPHPPTWRLLKSLGTGAFPNLREIVILATAGNDCVFRSRIKNVLWLNKIVSATQFGTDGDDPELESPSVVTLKCREKKPPTESEPSISNMKRVLLKYLK